jgi:hypothetical protein
MTSGDIVNLQILAEPFDSTIQVLAHRRWIDVHQVGNVRL